MLVITLMLQEYQPEVGSASPTGRRKFVAQWKKYLSACVWPTKSTSNDGNGSSSESGDSDVIHPADNGADDTELINDQCLAGSQDIFLQDNYRGTFQVHIKNLVPPAPERRTRVLDVAHVNSLVKSFRENEMGQLTIFLGLIDKSQDAQRLVNPGSGMVECLGGNHTRQALLTLMDEGALRYSTVQVRLYSDLSREMALSLGFAHNTITHEQRKVVTFLDKVRLMRDMLPQNDSSPAAIRVWKNALALIFKKKDGRHLQRQFSHHLLMARLPGHIWDVVIQNTHDIKVTERFFKPLMRLREEHVEEAVLCLQAGEAAYKTKMKKMLGDDNKLRKPPKKILQADDSILDAADVIVDWQEQNVDEDLEEKEEDLIAALKREVADLKAENLLLRTENTSLKTERDALQEKVSEATKQTKRKAVQSTEAQKKVKQTFSAKQKVWAFYQPHKKFYPAVILEVKGDVYGVKWIEDGIQADLEINQIKEFEE